MIGSFIQGKGFHPKLSLPLAYMTYLVAFLWEWKLTIKNGVNCFEARTVFLPLASKNSGPVDVYK